MERERERKKKIKLPKRAGSKLTRKREGERKRDEREN